MIARGELKITESRKRIEYRRRIKTGNGGYKWVTVGIMQVLSAEAYSKHGYKPSCVIFDELHAQPNRDLWDIMTGEAGASRSQPVWIVLTTAGDDPDRNSIGWEIHAKAVAIRDARQLQRIQEEGGDARKVLSLRHAADEDLADAEQELLERDEENWLPILYGLTAMFGDDPDDLAKLDIWDENLWYLCNPSLGKHLRLRNVRMEAMAAKKSEANERKFRWLDHDEGGQLDLAQSVRQNAVGAEQEGRARGISAPAGRHALLRWRRPVDKPRSDGICTALPSPARTRHCRDLALWHLEAGSNGR